MVRKSLYEILKVPRTASLTEIKTSYRKLALSLHPDVNKGDVSKEARFREVQDAYEVLSNDEKRRAYDFQGSSFVPHGPSKGGGVDSKIHKPPAYTQGVRNHRKTRATNTNVVKDQFDEKVWRAWHYGEGANTIIRDSVRQKNRWMDMEGSKHQSYFRKKNARQAAARAEERKLFEESVRHTTAARMEQRRQERRASAVKEKDREEKREKNAQEASCVVC
jgi:DnaJ-class molecular chaperone